MGIISTLVVGAPMNSSAKAPPAKPKAKAAPVGPAKQIFTRSDRSMRSEILGAEGKAAYIVSAMGTNSGILITDVGTGSMAAAVGVSEGDVLLSINQRVVTTARDADRILGDIPTGTIRVSFAHQSDNGLQLYNVNYRYAHQGAPAGMTSAATSAGAGGDKSATAQLVAQIPGAESHMLGVVNKDRATEQAPAVVANGSLAALARAHAQRYGNQALFLITSILMD